MFTDKRQLVRRVRQNGLWPSMPVAALGGVLMICSAVQAGSRIAIVEIGLFLPHTQGLDAARNHFQADPRIDSVAVHSVTGAGVPELGWLAQFDSIMVTTHTNLEHNYTGGGLGTQLGNILDDYVLQGGRVVFDASGTGLRQGIDGDILALSPLGPPVGIFGTTNGPVDLAGAVPHPVFDGISSFSSFAAYEHDISSNGIVLARFASNGTPAVVTTADDSIMFINGLLWDFRNYQNGTDFFPLFTNALTIPSPSTLAVGLLGFIAHATRVRRAPWRD